MSQEFVRKKRNKRSNDNDDHNAVKWTDEVANELHRSVRKKFRKRRVFTPSVDAILAIDIADMSMFSRTNRGYKYLLMIIDTFSKYGWIFPLKSKTGKDVAEALKKLFKSGVKCNKIWSDRGKEFLNKHVQKVFEDNDVTIYHTENEEKSCICERWIRTMKGIMYRYFTAARTRNYIDVLNAMVSKYNNTWHRSIKHTPTEARNPINYQSVFDSLYPSPPNSNLQPAFRVSDRVRIAKKKGTFEKGFEPNYTEELFEVSGIKKTDPITYTLKDLNGEDIKGSFYKENLVKSKQKVYYIDKILSRRTRNGIKEVRVSWSGYGSKFNQWIPASEVVNTRAARSNEKDKVE